MRCSFCNATEPRAGRLYTYEVHRDGAPPSPGRICAECSEMVNFMIRSRLASEGRVFQPDAEFPAIASHRFALRGPNGEESEAVVEIGLPYVVNDHSARCPLSVTGPIPMPWRHVEGASTLQAVCLAMSSAYNVLMLLDRQGWKWTDPYPDLDTLFGRRAAGTRPSR